MIRLRKTTAPCATLFNPATLGNKMYYRAAELLSDYMSV